MSGAGERCLGHTEGPKHRRCPWLHPHEVHTLRIADMVPLSDLPATPDAADASDLVEWYETPDDATYPAYVEATPAASTDPAPEGGLREAVEALADEFDNHLTTAACVDDEGWRCASCTTARALRHALAAHPAPDTPEQGQGAASADASEALDRGISSAQYLLASDFVDTILRDLFQGRRDHLRSQMLDIAAKVARKNPWPYFEECVTAEVAARESAAATRARAEGAAAERERIAQAVIVACEHRGGRHVCGSCWDAARIARSES